VIGWLRKRRRAARAAELAPSEAELRALIAGWPCLARLDRDERLRLARLTGEILAGKEFHGAGGLAPDRGDCLPVAAHTALTVLELGFDALDGFRSFILYREEFEVELEDVDDDGLVHRGRDLRAGEAWYGGPVVLSLADVMQSGQGDGYHVVAHEIAHQLDSLNGEPDGFPPLPASIRRQDWTDGFSGAFARLEQTLAAGNEPWIDEYGAESPAEFFAVTTEYFFDRPELLLQHEPDIYRLLVLFYRQDPAREADTADSRERPRLH
jgi:Mlc titration factor MtfA (ptsG expression regulator)